MCWYISSISTQFNLVMLVIAGARAVRVSHKCDEKPPAASNCEFILAGTSARQGKFNGFFFRMLIRLQRCWARADKRREKTRRWKLAYSSETKNLIVPNNVLCHCWLLRVWKFIWKTEYGSAHIRPLPLLLQCFHAVTTTSIIASAVPSRAHSHTAHKGGSNNKFHYRNSPPGAINIKIYKSTRLTIILCSRRLIFHRRFFTNLAWHVLYASLEI
jgi:hypothetical protein